MSRALGRDFFEAYYRAYNSADAALLAPFYDADVVLVSAQGEQRGREALLATYRYITERFTDCMTPQRILVDGDSAAVEIRDVFTAKQAVHGFLGRDLQAGESFTLSLCGLYRVCEGRITHISLYAR